MTSQSPLLKAREARVKPLEWYAITSPREDGPHEETGDWEGVGITGIYSVNIVADAYTVTDPDIKSVGAYFGGPDEARAAAQSDYEQRILSALLNPQEGSTK